MAGYSIDKILLESRESARRRTINFQAIFDKYDKEFEFDDDIDIHNGTIHSEKGYIRSKERIFGSSELATTKKKEERQDDAHGSDDETKYNSQLSFANPEFKVKSLNDTDPDIWKDLVESFIHDPGNEPSDAETISSVTSSSGEITDDETEDSLTDEFDDLIPPEINKQSPFLREKNNERDEWYSLKKCNKYVPPSNNIPDKPPKFEQNAVREPNQACLVKRINPCPVPDMHHFDNIVSIQPMGMIRPMVNEKSYENQQTFVSPIRANNHRNVSQALHQHQNACLNDVVSIDRQVNDKTIFPADQSSVTSQNLTALPEKQKITNEGQSIMHLLPSKNFENEKTLRRHVKPKMMLNERCRIRSQSKNIGIPRHQALSSSNDGVISTQMCDKIIQFEEIYDNIECVNSQFKNNLPTNISKKSLQSPQRCDQTYVVSKNHSTSFSYCDDMLSLNSKESPSTCMASLKLSTQSPCRKIKTSSFHGSIKDSFNGDLTPSRPRKNLMIEKTLETNNSIHRQKSVITTKDDMSFSKPSGNAFISVPPLIKTNSLDLLASPPRFRSGSRQRPQQKSTSFDTLESSSYSLSDEDCSLNQQTHLQTQFEQMFKQLFPQGLVDGHSRTAQEIPDKHSSSVKTLSKNDEVHTVSSPYDRRKVPKAPSSHIKDVDSFSPSKKQAEALLNLEQMMSLKNVERNHESKFKRTSISILAKESDMCYTKGDITTTSTDTIPVSPFNNNNRMKPRLSPKRPHSRSLECESNINTQNQTGSSPQKERRITCSISDRRELINLKTTNSVTHDGFVVPQSIHNKKWYLNKNKEKLPSSRSVNSSVYDWKSDATVTNYSTITNHGWYQSYKGPFHTSTPMKKSVPQGSDLDTSILSICSEIPCEKEI